MEVEKDFIMRQIKQIAKNFGSLLSRESLKEFLHYEQMGEESLSDEEIDQILLISSLKEAIEMNELSVDLVESEIGFSVQEIEDAHNLELILTREQQQKIRKLLDTEYS